MKFTITDMLSEMASQQQDPAQQMKAVDADEFPPEYRKDKHTSDRGHSDTSRQNIPSDQQAHHPEPANDSPGMITKFARMVWLQYPKQSSAKSDFDHHEQERYKGSDNTKHPSEEAHRKDSRSGQTPITKDESIGSKQAFYNTTDTMEGKEREWKARERELQHRISQISQISDHFKENTRILQARLHESESEKLLMQEQHNNFIRKQQEASFKQMESARWLPMDEEKVMDNLDRLKRDMRSWAKATSIKDISLLHSCGEGETTALMQDLANVALVENGQLPEGLATTAKSAMLLLNALLAHNVYASFFRSPFFFLRPEVTHTLGEIYELAQEANQQDANIWRSQTLRLMMPPLRNGASDAEKELHRMTENSIARAAEWQASNFLASPASYLIENKRETDFRNKLKKIYSDAAALSYMLWTRRTQMRYFTLHEFPDIAFDAEDSYFDPDSLVRYDDHEDHLKGKRATFMVHPLLLVYGTDEAKDYGQERVWAKGVVWLDSKNA